jgi:transposase
MYRELEPLRQPLSNELREMLPPPTAGVAESQLLQTYLDRLTLYVGCDVADRTFTLYAEAAGGEKVGYLEEVPNQPDGFDQAWHWLDKQRRRHQLRLIVLAMETTGVFYWAWWDYLADCPQLARVLYNPRTTEHMTEMLSKKVRNELVDAYALAEQVRHGATPEVVPVEDSDLLTARFASRAARDLAGQINRQKNQLRALLRAYNPALGMVFSGNKFHHPAAYALAQAHLFPDEVVAAGVDGVLDILLTHCRSAFDISDAERLVALCRHLPHRAIGREVIRQRAQHLMVDIQLAKQRQQEFLHTGFALIADRPETQLLKATKGAGISNTLALVSELGGAGRFADGEHMASFLGITTSKHISGTTLHHSKHITKQGPPNARFAAVNLAGKLCRYVPKYQQMYRRIKGRKPPRKGHFVALVAIARDFVSNILYDMWLNQRPFFLEVEDYRAYSRQQSTS